LEQEASDIVSTSSVQARQRVEVARERFAEEFHELEENCRQELERSSKDFLKNGTEETRGTGVLQQATK